ncbi:MAG: endonuclease MutS2 [Spirochaetota bacterium]|nr:MAG: endonuclease MutS2 [Spirochaetota bacterium]
MKRHGKYSLDLVEFNKVLNIIASFCTSDYSKSKLRRLKPTTDEEKLNKAFGELKELITLADNKVYPTISRIHDTRKLTIRAQVKDSCLTVDDLVRIRENILSFINLKKDLQPTFEETPLLAKLIGKLRIPHPARESIERAIDDHGNIRDEASNRLYEIVDMIRRIRSEIERILEGYFQAPETKRFIQEKTITMKDDRYVIPIKASFKAKIPGVIHSQSGSGETLFLEPFSVTEKNNQIKVFFKDKEKEIRKILMAVTSVVGKHAEEIDGVQDALAEMDGILAKYKFLKEFKCTIPQIVEDRMVSIKGARHPLLKDEVVPIDFELKMPTVGVVITGPNTGGKTVSLKTIGLLVLLAQTGFPVPADELKTFIFGSLYADIGDEQSIEQSLSTFSSHIKNIKKIIDKSDDRSLVLVDELGAGTDPIEGGAIGTAILDYLVKNNILTVVTTHFSSVKAFALSAEEVEVASVEFDPQTCTPTYRLIMGIPGKSNALEVADHLGLKRDILEKTKEFISDEDRAYEGVYRKLNEMEIDLTSRIEEVKRAEDELGMLTKSYSEKLKEVENEERFIREEYRHELSGLLEEYRKQIEHSIQRIREEQASRETIRAAKEVLKAAELEFLEKEKRHRAEEKKQEEAVFNIGDSVIVNHEYGEQVKGTVADIVGDDITVQVGIFKLTVKKSRVNPLPEKEEKKSRWDYEVEERDTPLECDIRGKRYDEAMSEVISFLDNAVLKNIHMVSIIHGLGTGALRQGVWEVLKKYKYVEKYDYALPENGGFGCTVVTLKK